MFIFRLLSLWDFRLWRTLCLVPFFVFLPRRVIYTDSSWMMAKIACEVKRAWSSEWFEFRAYQRPILCKLSYAILLVFLHISLNLSSPTINLPVRNSSHTIGRCTTEDELVLEENTLIIWINIWHVYFKKVIIFAVCAGFWIGWSYHINIAVNGSFSFIPVDAQSLSMYYKELS